MTGYVDPANGEVVESPMELVPLNLGDMDENQIAALIPTPLQAAAALQKARSVNSRVPGKLDGYRKALQTAERELKLAVALEVKALREDHSKATLSELRELATADDRVQRALDARDTAWLLFEYAKDWAKAIAADIELLRSINANFRMEHR